MRSCARGAAGAQRPMGRRTSRRGAVCPRPQVTIDAPAQSFQDSSGQWAGVQHSARSRPNQQCTGPPLRRRSSSKLGARAFLPEQMSERSDFGPLRGDLCVWGPALEGGPKPETTWRSTLGGQLRRSTPAVNSGDPRRSAPKINSAGPLWVGSVLWSDILGVRRKVCSDCSELAESWLCRHGALSGGPMLGSRKL